MAPTPCSTAATLRRIALSCGWDVVSAVDLPGGGKLRFCQPRHPMAHATTDGAPLPFGLAARYIARN